MAKYRDEIRLNMETSATNLQAAKDFLLQANYDAAVSSASDSAFHAGSALLLNEEVETNKHGDVLTLVQGLFVGRRRLTQEQGEKLNWLFQLGRDRKADATAPRLPAEAQKAVEFAESFFQATKVILDS